MASAAELADPNNKKRTFEEGKEWMKRAMKRLESKRILQEKLMTTLDQPVRLINPGWTWDNNSVSAGKSNTPSSPQSSNPQLLKEEKNKTSSADSSPPMTQNHDSLQNHSNELASEHHMDLMDFIEDGIPLDMSHPIPPLQDKHSSISTYHTSEIPLDTTYPLPSLHNACTCSQCNSNLVMQPLGSMYYLPPTLPKECPFNLLSSELLAHILRFAGWKVTIYFSQTCRYFYSFARSDLIWKNFCNQHHKSRMKPSTNDSHLTLHHGTKYFNLFHKFSTTLPKHIATTSFESIRKTYGNDDLGFQFWFKFKNMKETFTPDHKGFAIKYIPQKWIPRRIRCSMWIVSPLELSTEVLDNVMESFEKAWEDYLLTLSPYSSDSESESDDEGSSSRDRTQSIASFDRVIWPYEPEYFWVLEQWKNISMDDLVVFRFLEDHLRVNSFCLYNLSTHQSKTIIKSLE